VASDLADVLKEFVIKLGYTTDESSKRRFVDSVQYMGVAVGKLGLAVEGAAATVVGAVAKIASTMESLYYVSDRTKSTVAQIEALTFQFGQLGGSADDARGMLEKMAAQVRENPGFKALIESYTHVPYKDAVTAIEQISNALHKMQEGGASEFELLIRAKSLGISQDELLVMERGWKMSADGIHTVGEAIKLQIDKINKAVFGSSAEQQKIHEDNAVGFMNSLRILEYTVKAFWEKVAGDMAPGMAKSLDGLEQTLLDHKAGILKAVETISLGIVELGKQLLIGVVGAFDAVDKLVTKYQELDPETKHLVDVLGLVSLAIIGINAALNLGPLGIVVALLGLATAIGRVYESYQAWKSGKPDNFIDWDSANIRKIGDAIEWFAQGLRDAKADFAAFESWLEGSKLGRWWLKKTTEMSTVPLADMGVTSYDENDPANKATLAKSAQAAKDAANATGDAVNKGVDAASSATQPGEWNLHDTSFMKGLRNSVIGNMFGWNDDNSNDNQRRSPGSDATAWEHFDMRGASAAMRSGGLDSGGLQSTGHGAGSLSSPRVKEAMDILASLGYSAAQASGIIGNLYAESGLNPGAANASGHYGVAQWDTGRQLAFLRKYGHAMQGSSLREQLEFLDFELHNSEQAAGGIIQRATTPEESAVGMAASERMDGWKSPMQPGPLMAGRSADARTIYDLNMNGGATPNMSPAASGGGGGGVTVHQNNTIHVHGQKDPGVTADEVQRSLDRMHQDAFRAATSVVQ
jgi:hypothetical protein